MKEFERRRVDTDDMKRIAGAACLQLTSEELRQFAQQTEAMLCELDRMQEPGDRPDRQNVVQLEQLREDTPGASLDRAELLRASAKQDGACFAAPRVWKEEE